MSSWFHPETEKRDSPIQGRGLFARNAIAAGEVVAATFANESSPGANDRGLLTGVNQGQSLA